MTRKFFFTELVHIGISGRLRWHMTQSLVRSGIQRLVQGHINHIIPRHLKEAMIRVYIIKLSIQGVYIIDLLDRDMMQ